MNRKTCEICPNELNRGGKRFCSYICYGKWRRKYELNPSRTCYLCGDIVTGTKKHLLIDGHNRRIDLGCSLLVRKFDNAKRSVFLTTKQKNQMIKKFFEDEPTEESHEEEHQTEESVA